VICSSKNVIFEFPVTKDLFFIQPKQLDKKPIEKNIFDFSRNKDLYKAQSIFLSKYFKDVELFLRMAVLMDYKSKLNKKENLKLDTEISKMTKRELQNLLDVVDIQFLLEQWYSFFAPEKLLEENFIENLLIKYHSWEGVLFNRLYKKYVDNSIKEQSLWFSPKTSDSYVSR
jgi:hypothetical protein